MHDDRHLVERRLNRALAERVLPGRYTDRVPLRLRVWHVPDEPVPVSQALAAEYEPFETGSAWGAPWSTSWFRATGEVPAGWAGRRVEAVFDLGFAGDWPGTQAEALVHDADGVPIKGLEPRNQYVPIGNPAAGGEPVHLLIEAAANPEILANGFRPTTLGDKATAGSGLLYRFVRAELAVLDEPTWHLAIDLEVLRDLMLELGTGDPRRHQILRALERALDVLDAGPLPDAAPAARAELADVLARPAHASAHTLSAVGHAHIDSAWLWPVRETIRKTSRTFANVTALGRDYPELVFACSQAQQHAWAKQHYPEIFERIRAAVTAGRWVPVGGMWVEADGNLPGGEALARQLVHGKRFFLDEFGVETQGVWLPDSFGYTAAFPQLTRLAGMHWFLTQKLSWNDTNRFPHHTFWWEGLDGSRVFTHFPPIDTYTVTFRGGQLAHAVRNFADSAGGATRSLALFGYGDGGGGPTREMLERARRLRDLEGSPKVVVDTPDAFFAAAQAEYPDAPVWSGELYLELHRGTFTSQARTKAGNRRSEHLLREAELWAATAAVRTGAPYPHDELDRLWKAVLLNQFHDILPGSSIAWVHQEAEAGYGRIRVELEGLIGAAASRLAGAAGGPLVLNASPRHRREVALVPADGVLATERGLPPLADGGRQRLADGGVALAVDVPGGAAVPVAALPIESLEPVSVAREAGHVVLANHLVRVELDGDGLLSSVRDLRAGGREVLAPGARGNLLQLHPDRPAQWDAWDVERQYRRRRTDLTAADAVEVVDAGPLVATVRVTRTVGDSTLVQSVRLRAGSARIDVVTDADWQERNALLKAAFPLDVHADRSAAEIQFGHVHRPTHANTSWDAARFELYAHRWVHVGEPGYGVALLTDSTYGYDAARTTRDGDPGEGGGTTTTVRLSLLRAPQSPDPQADRGRHRFGYALLPGVGIAETVAEAYALNLPLRVVPAAEAPTTASPQVTAPQVTAPQVTAPLVTAPLVTAPLVTAPLVTAPLVTVTDVGERPPSATVEAVKLADDGSGDVVVRLYESLGGRATARVTAGFDVTSAVVTDLLERPLADAAASVEPVDPAERRVLEVALRPFQIVTLRLAR